MFLRSISTREEAPLHLQVDANSASLLQPGHTRKSIVLLWIGSGFVGFALVGLAAREILTPTSHAQSLLAFAAPPGHSRTLARNPNMLMTKHGLPGKYTSGELRSAAPLTKGQSRRSFLSNAKTATIGLVISGAASGFAPLPASALPGFVAGTDEEKSGLVVLRIAEVCSFQEKLLRTLAECNNPSTSDAKDQFGNAYCGQMSAYSVSPGQIAFATGVMLRNSNLDGNLKLMINTEVPRRKREAAVTSAVEIMNTINKLANEATQYEEFNDLDYVHFANIYRDARRKLARFFDYLPAESQKRFYGYAEEVREYEEKLTSEDGIKRMGV